MCNWSASIAFLMYACVCVCVCVRACVCMSGRVCMSVRVCMYVRMNEWMYEFVKCNLIKRSQKNESKSGSDFLEVYLRMEFFWNPIMVISIIWGFFSIAPDKYQIDISNWGLWHSIKQTQLWQLQSRSPIPGVLAKSASYQLHQNQAATGLLVRQQRVQAVGITVLLCFIDPRVGNIRNEASSCPGIFSRTLRFYYVASSPGVFVHFQKIGKTDLVQQSNEKRKKTMMKKTESSITSVANQ